MTKGRVLALLAAAIVLGYLPWFNFSAVVPLLREEFALTSGQIGTILAAFQLGFAVVVIMAGWLADRIGPRRVLAAGTFGLGLTSTVFALLGRDFATTLVLRVLMGMTAGAIYVPGMALLSGWFPPRERGHALGAYTGALTTAFAGSYFVAGPLAASYGWRMGIFWTSVPALVAPALVLLVPEHPPRSSSPASLPPSPQPRAERPGDGPQPGTRPLTGPAVLMTGAYMGHNWELFGFWGWVGPALAAAATSQGVGQVEAAALGGLMAALAILMGAPAPWLLGLLADRAGRTASAGLCLALSAPAVAVLGWLIGGPLAVVMAVAVWYGFWVIADSAIYKAGLTELVVPQVRATALGLQSTLGFLTSITAPQVFGWILDMTNAPGQATNWGPAFTILAVGPLVGLALLIWLRVQPAAALMAGGRR